jgi:ZIP family zinc transporter
VVQWFQTLGPVWQALIATSITWLFTAFGAAIVASIPRVSQRFLDGSLGMASGVMLAASFWSLLHPSIEMAASAGWGSLKWVPALLGFLAGALFLRGIDWVLPHLHPDLEKAEGLSSTWRRTTLLVMAITLHNVPEGLAVGIAFGGAASSALSPADQVQHLGAAVALVIGIALQNIPEGMAVALPIRAEGHSRLRAVWWGQLSSIVEPIAGVMGAVLVVLAGPVLPYALAFAGGAMIFVVAEELIPESQRHGNVDLATMCLVTGFAIMMVLDAGLG